jgi:RNA polymerase sigma-70 factor (ECF subfamily)
MKKREWRRTLQSALAEERAVTSPSEFERVFRAHHGLVFRTAYRITGNAADAEDVSQTVFLRLLRRQAEAKVLEDTVLPGEAPQNEMRQNDALQNHVLQNHVLQNEESYLRRAAINAALDVMRARRADRTVELEDLPAERGREDPRELRQALGRALAQLKTRPAEIFALRFFEGFSNPQIARMLGISQVLVAVIVHRTRQQLRKELGAYLSQGSQARDIQETGHE